MVKRMKAMDLCHRSWIAQPCAVATFVVIDG
jgi:hypothetical protein